ALTLLIGADESWARVQREGVLRVGMDASYPPFELVDDAGRFSGLDVDLAQALAQRWGVRLELVNIHFDGLYDALFARRVDLIISALPHDPLMTRDVRYSQSYLNAGQTLVYHCAALGPRTADELTAASARPARVAVELGSEAHQTLRLLARDRALNVTIMPEREMEDATARLLAGEAEALLCDRVCALGQAAAHPELCASPALLTDEPYVIAAGFGAPQLISQVDAALVAWRADGALAALEQRWLAAPARRP
ncbi:MAG: transporter substrate-binding domain-containing protein, partial [Chloroflexota bacterium]